jgi:hypothetical protein
MKWHIEVAMKSTPEQRTKIGPSVLSMVKTSRATWAALVGSQAEIERRKAQPRDAARKVDPARVLRLHAEVRRTNPQLRLAEVDEIVARRLGGTVSARTVERIRLRR